jgi:hypothetical protein
MIYVRDLLRGKSPEVWSMGPRDWCTGPCN